MSEGVDEQGRGGTTITLLEDVTLTDDFDDNESEAYNISSMNGVLNQLELIFDYTMHADETDAKAVIKLLLSENGTDYHEYSIASDQSPSTGVVQSILYPRRFRIDGVTGAVTETRWYAVPTSAKYFKIQASEEDTTGIPPTPGTLTARARVSYVG